MNKKIPSIVGEIIKSRGTDVGIENSDINKIEVDAEAFFKNQCPKAEFKSLILTCDNYELLGLELIMELMANKENFDVSPFEKFDQNKKPYVWVTKKNKFTTNNFKVRTAGKMLQLIDLYGRGYVNFKTSLAELYEASKG